MSEAVDKAQLEASLQRATQALLNEQRADGHFLYELEADATIPAEYILLRHFLGEPVDGVLEGKIGTYLRRIQSGVHDGWPLYDGGAFDISASVKAYFALKMIGDDTEAPHMARARAAILQAGGAEAVNVFTRIQLALFGAGPWETVPTIPPELILAPRWFPVHLLKMSYWARTVVVPLLVLCALKPVARNPRGVLVPELYTGIPQKLTSQAEHVHPLWKAGFEALDRILKRMEGKWPHRMRQRAIQMCHDWVVERLNGEDGLGAIYPAMANAVMMFAALGVEEDHPHRAIARVALDRLLVVKEHEAYCQPCVSPVWDTALAAHALLEVGSVEAQAAAHEALDWLAPRQITQVVGDWAEQRPDVAPGGWAFQYSNDYYPDLDDTAVVAMAMHRASDQRGGKDEAAVDRAAQWCLGLQGHDGGFAAFDADNVAHYLNNLPFADHGALLDPPTADVSARVVSMLAQLGEPLDSPRMQAALRWLEKEQEPEGSWFGRWGVNHVYGTWSVLCALGRAGIAVEHPMVARAVAWLKLVQNADGGWGESCDSYALDSKGHQTFISTACQTAWACLGLMAVGQARSEAVARGMAWLVAHQREDGLWGQEAYTGGGFPRVFYLRYHGYPRYFPLWAMARYRRMVQGNQERPEWGM
ncbi:squalene--hopene cyclase [Novosphingobium umbonatum]|uniref:Squalene--hopene cyclase n=1 Tax=Novosphingobium umbonatum TaxID=1908524 RepID=A0A3S2V7A6_9SPHN|nr:squalene--hopene cyclase [Novosphingobium umbonatum]RVU05457.1 squalene--hopene cyclase [Novosphingobium umbonatum]